MGQNTCWMLRTLIACLSWLFTSDGPWLSTCCYRQTCVIPRSSLLVSVVIRHCLSLHLVCGTCYRLTSADQILLYFNSVERFYSVGKGIDIRYWNLKLIFTQKWASVDMNWGVQPKATPPGNSNPGALQMFLFSRAILWHSMQRLVTFWCYSAIETLYFLTYLLTYTSIKRVLATWSQPW